MADGERDLTPFIWRVQGGGVFQCKAKHKNNIELMGGGGAPLPPSLHFITSHTKAGLDGDDSWLVLLPFTHLDGSSVP